MVPAAEAAAGIECKRSQFLASLVPAEKRSQVDEYLATLRTNHEKATHIVYAFCLGGYEREILGMTDAGEPKGTAGRPVMDVLQGANLTNALITVVRYFGGTKLGTGGLVRAYGDAAKSVIEAATLIPLLDRVDLEAAVPYSLHGAVARAAQEIGAELVEERFEVDVYLRYRIEKTLVNAFCRVISDLSAGNIEFTTN